MNIHIPKINLVSTKKSGNPFFGLQTHIFIFPVFHGWRAFPEFLGHYATKKLRLIFQRDVVLQDVQDVLDIPDVLHNPVILHILDILYVRSCGRTFGVIGHTFVII